MIDIRINHQASVFMNCENLGPFPEVISTMMNMFHDMNLIPNTFQEIIPNQKPAVRLRLSTTDNEWEVRLVSNRIDIFWNQTDPKGSNIGELPDFNAYAVDIFTKIMDTYKKRANRFALISTSLLEEMDNARLDSIYFRLFNPITFFGEHPPFEWDCRSASHITLPILKIQDVFNTIVLIKRVQGEMILPIGGTHFDRIMLQFDINTSPENQESRFKSNHIKPFYDIALDQYTALLKQVLEYINAK